MADLVQKLVEIEAYLDAANRVINKKNATLEKLNISKEIDDVIEILRFDLKATGKKNEVEVERLEDVIVNLQESIDRLRDENEMLKKGEGADLEALADSSRFAVIKVYPDLDLSFLTRGVDDSLDAVIKEPGADGGVDSASIEFEVNPFCVIILLGIPNQQIMFFHIKFITSISFTLLKASTSIHSVK